MDVRCPHRCHASGDDHDAAGCDASPGLQGGRTTRTNTSERLAVKYSEINRAPGRRGWCHPGLDETGGLNAPTTSNTGDAGSTRCRRDRAMDAQRGAAWKAALKKLARQGRSCADMPAEAHAALLRPGLFDGPRRGRRPRRGGLRGALLAARIRLVAHRPAGSHHCGQLAQHRVGHSMNSTPTRRCGTTFRPSRA